MIWLILIILFLVIRALIAFISHKYLYNKGRNEDLNVKEADEKQSIRTLALVLIVAILFFIYSLVFLGSMIMFLH